jgi:hypothetical protein
MSVSQPGPGEGVADGVPLAEGVELGVWLGVLLTVELGVELTVLDGVELTV